MKTEEPRLAELRKKIETMSGVVPKTPRDFDYLGALIFSRTRTRLSTTTLKRFWGYIEKDSESQIRTATLDILSSFAGYASWAAFCNSDTATPSSDFIGRKELLAKNLQIGNVIRLLWEPDRCVLIRYEGSDVFTVIESRNSKLMVGDTFHASAIVEHQELLVTELCRQGMPPCSYVCGRVSGVRFEMM